MHGISEWLRTLGLSEYAQSFAENYIDFSVLHDLTDQDLEKIGIPLGHRKSCCWTFDRPHRHLEFSNVRPER
jgi:hypothetical protein